LIVVLLTLNLSNALSLSDLKAKTKRKCGRKKAPECTVLTPVGFEPIHRLQPDTASNFYWRFDNIVIPQDQIITTFSIYMDGPYPVQLVIFRGSITIVGKSEVFTTKTGLNVFNLAQPIPVLKGDLVGNYNPQVGGTSFSQDGCGSVAYALNGNPNSWTGSVNRCYSIQVTGKICSSSATPAPSDCPAVPNVGFDLIHRIQPDTASNFYWRFDNIVIAQNQLITTFGVYMDLPNPVQLVIYRNGNTVVGKSEVFTTKVGVNNFTLAQPIPVLKGDVVGNYNPQVGGTTFSQDGCGTIAYALNGQPTTWTGTVNRCYSVQVGGRAC